MNILGLEMRTNVVFGGVLLFSIAVSGCSGVFGDTFEDLYLHNEERAKLASAASAKFSAVDFQKRFADQQKSLDALLGSELANVDKNARLDRDKLLARFLRSVVLNESTLRPIAVAATCDNLKRRNQAQVRVPDALCRLGVASDADFKTFSTAADRTSDPDARLESSVRIARSRAVLGALTPTCEDFFVAGWVRRGTTSTNQATTNRQRYINDLSKGNHAAKIREELKHILATCSSYNRRN